MEVEANRFASLILIPPPQLRKDLAKLGDAELAHISQLARRYDVSKDAMARSYARYHPDLIAILVCKDGRILRHYDDGVRFPYIVPSYGQPVPAGSLYYRSTRTGSSITEIETCLADVWLNVERGKAAPILNEQVYFQRDGFALLLLKLETRDEDEENEERDLQKRWHVGFGR